MQDGEHDALHIPGLGDASNNATVGNNGNKLLIAATLTAIFLAGSAMVYRSRSMYSSSTMTPLFSTTSQKADEQATSSKDAQKGKREVRHADGEGEEPSDGAESNNGPSASVLPAKSNNEGESSGQSKSARRKERRKRGKDPLKEMQKGGKKLKALVPNASGSATKDPAAAPLPSVKSKATVSESGNAEDGEEHADDASQASSSTSHLPDSQQTLSRSKGKRALREGSIDITGKGAATGAGIMSHGDTSVSRHARVASTSEVSQKQYPQQSSDGPSSSKNPNLSRSATHNSSQSHSDADTHSSNPRNQRPINTPSSSSTVHDDHPPRRLRSPSLAATTSSRRVTGHDEIDNRDASNIHAADLERPDRLTGKSQVHQTGLADADTHSEADSTAGGVKQSHRRRTRARADEDADNAYGHSSINVDIPFDASTVETSSTATTTATGPASLASSLVLSSPATSPALSSSPYSVEQSQAGMKKVDNDDVEMITALSNTGKDKASLSSALPSSMSSSFTSTSTNTENSTTRKAQKAQASGNPSKGKSALPTPVSDPWDWDGVGSSSTVEGSKEKGNDKSLKKKSSRSEAPLSAVAGSPMSSSVSHPSSLYSPTKSSFAALVAGNLTSSSATTSSVSGASASQVGANPSSGLGSDAGTEAQEGREEEGALVFPTLNPIATPTANGFGASGSSRPTPARRAPTPRRPGTPSRSSSTSTPPPSSSTSSLNATSTHGNHSNNLNNSTMSGSSSNSNMPALSTQTQLASLRGALEAARLREEKNKAEIEKYIKELDMLRWENANWRRGENELKAHIQHLMHQLQAYAAFYNNAAPHLNAQFQQQRGNGNNGTTNSVNAGSSTSSAPNGFTGTSGSSSVPGTPHPAPASSLSSPSSSTPPNVTQSSQTQSQTSTPALPHSLPPLPLHQMVSLQMNGPMSSPGVLSPVTGMFSPGGMGTPPVMGMHPGSPSSFFPYQMPHPPPHPLMLQQMHMMQQQQLHHHQQQQQQQQSQQNSALPSPHQASIFSSIFPAGGVPPSMMSPHQQHHYPAFAAAQAQMQQQQHAQASSSSAGSRPGSGPPSAAGTSSAGSLSPDLTGSSSPGLNGKRSSRSKGQSALSDRALGRKSWEDIGDGWIAGGTVEESAIEGISSETVGEAMVNGDEEDDSGINEALADAILKRPGSIRMHSSSSTSRRGQLSMEPLESKAKDSSDNGERKEEVEVDKEEEGSAEVEQLTEFTFPSISNLGNVNYKGYEFEDYSASLSPSPASLDPVDAVVEPSQDSEIYRTEEKAAVDESEAGVAQPAVEDWSGPTGVEEVVAAETSPISPSSNQESDTTPRKEVSASGMDEAAAEIVKLEEEEVQSATVTEESTPSNTEQ